MYVCKKIDDYIKLYNNNAKDISYAYNINAGIYFLIKDNIVVYVGMSRWSVKQRCEQHWDKQYNRVKYICINRDDNIELAEYVYINIFNPKYNKIHKNYEYKLTENQTLKLNNYATN
jgi:hypothetical protein